MEFKVEDIQRKFGSFTDPKTGVLVEYDNTFPYLVARDKEGNYEKSLLPKIKTPNIPVGLCVGDYVKVFYNEYKTPEALVISRKGDKQ